MAFLCILSSQSTCRSVEPRVPTRHGPPATTRHGRAEIIQSAHAISDANGGGEILALHPQWKCMQFAHRGVLLERPVG